MSDNRLVYSTETGKIASQPQPDTSTVQTYKDGIARIKRETKGRKGKGVSIIDGLQLPDKTLKDICTKLKKACGAGGAVKNGRIEIQTDNREKIKELLAKQSIDAKLAGG